MQINPVQYQALLRRDFYAFLVRSFMELNPTTDFAANWHVEVIAQELERCRTGETKRLIINLPPRSLKSHCASIAFAAWVLGHNPSAQVICASYAQDLADKHAIDCRALMNSAFYKEVFPTRLSPEKRAVADFLTTQRGSRKATSVGGVLTGRGADFIIIDDPLQPDKALSDTRRSAVNDWYDNTLVSRLNHKLTGCIILVMQRLHEDDLVGHVLDIERKSSFGASKLRSLEASAVADANGGGASGSVPSAVADGCFRWRVLRFPAIAEEDEHYTVHRLGTTFTYSRRAGEPLHPEREPLEILAQLRETQGEYHFAGQYQQSPAPMGGGMIKSAWFKTYTESEIPNPFDFVFQSWDTANKATELSDHSVCTTWGVRGTRCGSGGSSSSTRHNLYLLHVLRRRMEYPELKRTVRAHAAEWKARNVLIEDKASGTQLCQELIHEGMHGVTRCKSVEDKKVRMSTSSSTIENGFVHLPEKAPWLVQYLHEIVTFPNSKHFDQVDSTSQALNWAKTHLGVPNILLYYREQALQGIRDGSITDFPKSLLKYIE